MLLQLHPIVERTCYGVSENDILRVSLSTINDSSLDRREGEGCSASSHRRGRRCHRGHTAHSRQQQADETAKRDEYSFFFEFLELTNTKTTEENTKLLLGALKRAYQQVGNKPLYVIMIPQIGMNCVSLYILCFLNVNLAILFV